MQTAGSGPDSPSTAIFATLPAIKSGHPGNLGLLPRCVQNESRGGVVIKIRSNFIVGLTLAVAGLGLLLWSESAAAASRVNVMPDRQVRPGVSLPVFGNAGNGGAIGNGSATGETYTWSFSANANVTVTDDGSLTGAVGNDRNIVENVTFGLIGSTRAFINATLTVDDGAGGIDSDLVQIDIVDPTDPISDTALENLQIDVNIAIEDAMRALYLNQRPDGRWRHSTLDNDVRDCGTTGFTVWGFANSGHQPTNDIDTDIYAEFVQQGVRFMLGLAQLQAVIFQANIGNPDRDLNDRILSLCGNSFTNEVGYANPIGTASILAAFDGAPNTFVPPGSFAGQREGDTYFDVVQDLIDWIAYAQSEGAGIDRGGWRYTANGGADTSADSWHFVAMEGFEVVFGGTVLELVKQESELRIDSSQSQGGVGDLGQFGYVDTSPLRFDGNATTAAGLSGLVMSTAGGRTPTCLNGAGACTSVTFPDAQSRKDAAVAHLGLKWDVAGNTWTGNRNNFYAMWTTARALRLNETPFLVDKNGVTFKWQTGEDQANEGVLPPDNDVHEGYFPWLVRAQNADGTWPATVNPSNWTSSINTAWALLILQPTVFGPPPTGEIELTISGACPGSSFLHLVGATPNGSVALSWGTAEGPVTLPPGPCAGTEIGLADPNLLDVLTADQAGRISLERAVGASACGLFVQALDVATCGPSNVAIVP